jgi:hypothetical protein
MFDAFIDGLFLVLQWKAFTLMLAGMALGFCVGLPSGVLAGTHHFTTAGALPALRESQSNVNTPEREGEQRAALSASFSTVSPVPLARGAPDR